MNKRTNLKWLFDGNCLRLEKNLSEIIHVPSVLKDFVSLFDSGLIPELVEVNHERCY